MTRQIIFLALFATLPAVAQISNVRQTLENGRIIVTYDLKGHPADRYTINVAATNENGDTLRPAAIVGDLAHVTPEQGRTIWWEPQLEGLTATGWKIALNAKEESGIRWVLVEGAPGRDFYISATEITFDQYDQFCAATGYPKPDADFGRGKHPVINVNVADALAFCKWMSEKTGTTIRLPEENEWEYAARGGNRSKNYEYGGSDTIDEVAWYIDNSQERTHEVAEKKPNELGIYDMSGNVWEWCGTSGTIRGGSWHGTIGGCRIVASSDRDSGERSSSGGFRILQKR